MFQRFTTTVSNPWREAIEVIMEKQRCMRCMFPILGGRLLKGRGNWNIGVAVFKFPILGGRLLK